MRDGNHGFWFMLKYGGNMKKFYDTKTFIILLGLLIPQVAIGASGPTVPNASVTSIAVNPTSQNIMYAGTKATIVGATSGLYKTTDWGTTWTLTSLKQDIGFVIVDPATPSTVYASPFILDSINSTAGLFKSTDGGVTWSNIDILGLIFGNSLPVSKLIFDINDVMYAITTDFTSVYKSADAGTTWTPIFGGISGVESLAISPANPLNMVLVTVFDGIFKSSDGGTSSVAANTGLPVQSLFFKWVKYDPINPNIVYASNGTVYKSTDGGTSWNVGPAVPFLPSVALNLNAASFNTGSSLTLTRSMFSGIPVANADIYVALLLPDGTLLIFQPNGSASTAITPRPADIPVPSATDIVFNYTFTGAEPIGTYTWFAALGQPKTLNVIGSIAQVSFTFGP